METSSLLPCPFCGSTPRVLEAQAGYYPRRIICDKCHFHRESNGRDTADELWNTRAKPEQSLSPEFIRATNENYAAWCRTFYVPDSLDEAGRRSLDGLWAWQVQELVINDHKEVIQNLARKLLAASAHLNGCVSSYEKHASRDASVGRAVKDPFFTTRIKDYQKAADETTDAARKAIAYRDANAQRTEHAKDYLRDRLNSG